MVTEMSLSKVLIERDITIFHEPINIRAENVARINQTAADLGVSLNTEVFSTWESWQDYATNSLKTVERLAGELGIGNRLHLWPDKSLGAQTRLAKMPNRVEYFNWLTHWWSRVSEWPDGDSRLVSLPRGEMGSYLKGVLPKSQNLKNRRSLKV